MTAQLATRLQTVLAVKVMISIIIMNQQGQLLMWMVCIYTVAPFEKM